MTSHRQKGKHPYFLISDRIKIYDGFKQFKHRILVATEIFGRGIDIEKINIVFNYDWDWNQFFSQSSENNTNVKKEFAKLYKGYPNANLGKYLKSFEKLSNNDLNFLDVEMGLEKASNNEKCEDINSFFFKKNNN